MSVLANRQEMRCVMAILDQSLCMLQGVSPEVEIRLRRAGVMSCAQLAAEAESYFSVNHARRIRESYGEWMIARAHGLVDWEVNHLPVGHRVRALREYWDDTLFYDIETDGTMAASPVFPHCGMGEFVRFGEDIICRIFWLSGLRPRY